MAREIETSESRYQRQADLLEGEGWAQEKLKKARIALIGGDALANYAAITLSAFGFGTIEAYAQGLVDEKIKDNQRKERKPDYSRGFLYYEAYEDKPRSKALEEIIRKINPEISMTGINLSMQRAENCRIIGKPDMIIEATNDPASKLSALEYASQMNIPMISMSAGREKGGVGLFDPSKDKRKKDLIENLLFYEQKDEPQDPIVSQVIGGIGIEEARKLLNPMKGEKVIDDLIIYNLASRARFDHGIDQKLKDGSFDLSDYSACLVGAGALGNFAGLGLSLRNIGKLVIVDYDITELTNLNRQVLLYDAVDVEKSVGLVRNLKKINPRPEYVAKVDKILPSSEEFFRKNKFDIIIDTVDNNKTRALLNYFSLKQKTPFISGGTRYNSGQVNVSVPEKSGCLNCQANIDELALQVYRRRSCVYAAQPSVITSNQITAGLMVGEIPLVLGKKMGDFARGEMKFVSNEDYRLSLLPAAGRDCKCYTDKKLQAEWLEKMRGVYD